MRRGVKGDLRSSWKQVASILGAVLLFCYIALAAEPDFKAKYKELVEKVRSGDQTVDLNELRMAAGKAGITSDIDARHRLMTAARNRDFKKMAEAADAVLATNYADLDGHFFAKIAANELHKPEMAEFHRWVEMGLLNSLRSSGNGQTAETAMKVISVDEEYFVLRMMGQSPRRQALGTCAGHPCDIMTTVDQKSKEHTWYFDVEIPMSRMAKALGE